MYVSEGTPAVGFEAGGDAGAPGGLGVPTSSSALSAIAGGTAAAPYGSGLIAMLR